MGEKEGNLGQKQRIKAIILCGSVLFCGLAAWFGSLGDAGTLPGATEPMESAGAALQEGRAGGGTKGAAGMEVRCGVDGRGAAGRQAPPGKGAEVTVCVSGAVQRPGLYRVPKGARVQEVLLLAGGYTFDADPDRVNLARPCKDGTHVRVPRLSQKQLRERWKRSRG